MDIESFQTLCMAFLVVIVIVFVFVRRLISSMNTAVVKHESRTELGKEFGVLLLSCSRVVRILIGWWSCPGHIDGVKRFGDDSRIASSNVNPWFLHMIDFFVLSLHLRSQMSKEVSVWHLKNFLLFHWQWKAPPHPLSVKIQLINQKRRTHQISTRQSILPPSCSAKSPSKTSRSTWNLVLALLSILPNNLAHELWRLYLGRKLSTWWYPKSTW